MVEEKLGACFPVGWQYSSIQESYVPYETPELKQPNVSAWKEDKGYQYNP